MATNEAPTNEGSSAELRGPSDPHLGEDDAARSGPCAGIVESLSLVFIVPGFSRLALFMIFMSGGVVIPWVYVLPPLQTEIWGDKAASNTSYMQAARSLFSMLLAAQFGKWSDKKGRRLYSLMVMTIAGFSIGLPELFLGSHEPALWVSVGLIIATGPMAVHLTGSPVVWAFAADILPVEHRETGFAIIMACASFGTFFIQVVARIAVYAVPGNQNVFYVITLACLAISLMILVSLRDVEADNASDGEIEVEAEKTGCAGLAKSFISPLKLLQKKATLRAVCMVAAFLTFADLAASDISAQVLYEMLDVGDDTTKMQDASFFYACLPQPFAFVVMIMVGVAARRFSPHVFVRAWLPITSVLFAVPALISVVHAHWMIVLGGFCSILPLSNYGPLQALVVHVVPPNRVGEAMGSMAACKNLVACIAPFIMGSMAEWLAATDKNYLLWAVYPLCAVVMLCAWPFTWLLQKRVPRESHATWSSWASTARPSLFRPSSGLAARLSAGTHRISRPSTSAAEAAAAARLSEPLAPQEPRQPREATLSLR